MVILNGLFEPRRQKTGLQGFRLGPTRTGAGKSQRMARGSKFWIWKAEG